MKSDLVIVNGELGLIVNDSENRGDSVGVKRLAKGYVSNYDHRNVHYVNLPVIGEKDNEKR